MASVTLDHVWKRYSHSHQAAVKDFCLHIEDKEFLVFVGPSGCGKSTTLRMIAGLDEVSDGGVYIGDEFVNDLPPKDRDIAMVFQNYALYPNMDVFENMAFGLRLRKVSKSTIETDVRRAARTLEIEPFLDRKPRELSGGQRQRVALGRAIVRSPRVFLMDEPLSNLDAKLRVHMRAEIIKLHRKLETTFIYVTHDQTEAMTMGTRIVVMKDGIIQQVAPPEEIYSYPANKFVAGFIGSPPMNFIDGTLQEESGDILFHTKRFTLKLTGDMTKALSDAGTAPRQVTLGVRPENISVEEMVHQAFPDAVLTGEIEVTELMGADRFLYADIGGQTAIVRVDPRRRYNEKEKVRFAVDMSKTLLFHPETGERIV